LSIDRRKGLRIRAQTVRKEVKKLKGKSVDRSVLLMA